MHDIAEQRSIAWLAGAGLRPTRQRLALATLLVGDGRDRHVTAEGLFAAARQSGEGVSLATVYNTLRAFCEAGPDERDHRGWIAVLLRYAAG